MPHASRSQEGERAGPTAEKLLRWYDRHARALPWRAPPGQRTDVYRVWLSEIMLQQTTVATVGPYFEKFIATWPTVEALAAAERDDVLAAWAGLGYYSRARNLHACAQHVAVALGGHFPSTEAGLLELPGIGPYTAAAIAAIAFNEPATVVDGNVERVMARYHAVEDPLPGSKKKLRELASQLTPTLSARLSARPAGPPARFARWLMTVTPDVLVPPTCCPAKARKRKSRLAGRSFSGSSARMALFFCAGDPTRDFSVE